VISSGSARRDVLVAALLALAVVGGSVACAESPTESDAYQKLELLVSSSKSELVRLDAELASLTEQESSLDEQELSLGEQASSLRTTVEAKTEESGNAGSRANAAWDEVENWKKSSNAWRKFLTRQIRIVGDQLCAETVVANLGSLGVTSLGVEDIFKSKPQLSKVGLVVEAGLLGVAAPKNTCPSWWIWDDTPFMSGDDLKETLCSEIDLGKISKAPMKYQGECFLGKAQIVQWDLKTGECVFHAVIGKLGYEYVRVEFTTSNRSCDFLEKYGQGDLINWRAAANGVLTYETVQGETMSIPTFTIFSIGRRTSVNWS